MNELLRTILIMSISGGIIALLLLALKPFARNHLLKSAQYYLWLVVILALFIPVSKLVVLQGDTTLSLPVAPIQEAVERTFTATQEGFDRGYTLIPGTEQGRPIPPESTVEDIALSLGFYALTTLSFLYPLGIIIVMLYFIISYSIYTKLHRRRNVPTTIDEITMLIELCGGKQTPQLYRNPLAATSMLIGIFRPAIILPDKEYTDAQLRAVLLHELTHLRRKDVLVKWFSVLVTAIHWFNPIVWLVRREIDRACELACDEAVIRNLDTNGKQNYGETLLYVAADSKTPHAVLSTTMCEEKKALKERLGAIMKSRKHTRLAVVLSAVLIIAVGGTAIALGAGRAAKDELIEFEVVYSNVTEYSRTEQFKRGDILYSVYIVNGEIQTPGNSRGLKEIGYAFDDFGKFRIFEREGYSVDEFIVVQDYGFMNGATIYVAENTNASLTLDDVRALATKGDALQYSDFPSRGLIGLSSIAGGYNPILYGVEGGYRLLINFNDTMNPESGIRSTALESIWESGGSGIDIRYNDVDEFIRTHPSHPADTVPRTSYTPREWINRQNLDYAPTTTVDLMLDEFPDVLFSYTPEKLTATNKNGTKELFGGTDGFIFGGYIDNLFLADLNGDGLPEFCGTTNYGSGYGDLRVIVYDYANDKRYVLSDRGTYDYFLQMENGQLEVIQTDAMQMSNMPRGVGNLAIINGELVLFGIDRTASSVDPQPTTPTTHSPFMSSWRPLHELPVDYSTEQAVADSVYVNIHGSQIYNEVMVDQFYADVYSGSAAFLRVMLYTIEGDAILVDYQYDGEMFTVTHDSTRDKFGEREIATYNYKYLVADDRSASQSLSYYLSNEKNIFASTGNALIEGIWQLPALPTQADRAPQLEVTLTTNGFPEQRIEAARLTTSWTYIDENGNNVSFESDSPHALQLDNYDDITLRLNGSSGEITFNFGGRYKPQSVSVQRWDAVYYMGRQYIESFINQNEPVTVNGNTLRISNDGNDYIYEVYAVFEQGSSYYAFRVNAEN